MRKASLFSLRPAGWVVLSLCWPVLLVGCQLIGDKGERRPKPVVQPAPYLRLVQQGRQQEVRDGARLRIARRPFSLVFPLAHYSSDKGGWYSVRIACSERGSLLQLKVGSRTEAENAGVAPFAPGRGLATRGSYEVFLLDAEAHHYIVYQPGNPVAERATAVRAISSQVSEVRVDVNRFRYDERNYTIRRLPLKEVHFAVLMDQNLNGVMDPGELFRFTLVLR